MSTFRSDQSLGLPVDALKSISVTATNERGTSNALQIDVNQSMGSGRGAGAELPAGWDDLLSRPIDHAGQIPHVLATAGARGPDSRPGR